MPGTIAGLVAEWDEIAERHFPAYRARLTTFQGQRRLRLRLRLREFLPRVGIDASSWSDERLDELFNTYLVAYEAARRSFPAEARHLRVNDCVLPKSGWGELVLLGSTPGAGGAWTDSGQAYEDRELKHRGVRDTRPVQLRRSSSRSSAPTSRHSLRAPTAACS